MPHPSQLYREGWEEAIIDASSAVRFANSLSRIDSCTACAPSPTAPIPSNVGIPSAAVKFPSEPPPSAARLRKSTAPSRKPSPPWIAASPCCFLCRSPHSTPSPSSNASTPSATNRKKYRPISVRRFESVNSSSVHVAAQLEPGVSLQTRTT